ncbi:MAG: CAP domain-containing protein [Myxococcota bacterium]|jgi:uncharacterized protein YkwD|nr:CAP domain-containing protein [Myxococcota bacterium]
MNLQRLPFGFVLVTGLLTGCVDDVYTGKVPDNPHCSDVDDWPDETLAWESRIFELINYARALGANCTEGDHYPPTHPYKPHPSLVCAARLHSMDMDTRSYFDHINPEGQDPTDRAISAGFTEGGVGENIAAGQGSPEQQFADWMASPGHCSAIMSPDYYYIGIGTFLGSSNYGDYSTANFGTR